MSLPKYEASFRRVFRKYKYGAMKRKIDFDLDSNTFRVLAEKNCVYCGAKPTPPNNKAHDKLNGAWEYNGLDRIDNNKGYIKGNVQPCCTKCNKLKSNLEEKDFLDHIQTIVSYRGGTKDG